METLLDTNANVGKKLVSIIVPVYNVEPYLNKCLDSIADQTYKNLQIILIDDGSIDNSGLICDEYAKRDARFLVLHNSNHGVSYSRNQGLDLSEGEYILFIDSDDFIDKDYVELLCREIEYGGDNDIVICKYDEIFDNEVYEKKIETNNLTGDFQNDLCILYELMMGPYNKMYKRSVIRRFAINFNEEIEFSEDRLFNYNYCLNINKYKYIDKSLYHYCKLNTNSLSKQRKIKSFKNALFVLEKEKDFLFFINAKNRERMLCSSAFFYAGCFLSITGERDTYNKFCDRMNLLLYILHDCKIEGPWRCRLFFYLLKNDMFILALLFKNQREMLKKIRMKLENLM